MGFGSPQLGLDKITGWLNGRAKNTPFKMLNSSHFYLFTNIDTEVLGNTLPAHTNFLVSFKVDTTFTIEEQDIFAKAFPGQSDLLKVLSLKIESTFDVLKIWISMRNTSC